MNRILLEKLYRWKDRSDRKPLLLKGVRQSGKTYLLKEFGKEAYSDVAYFNFEGNEHLHKCFEQDLDPRRIATELGVFRRGSITPGKTLIILDEIQFCNRALTSLKYFCEDAPEYHVVCAGSLLGIALSKPLSFPVGKVDLLTLRPMSFYEFVLAYQEKEMLEYLSGLDAHVKMPEVFTGKLMEHLRNYFIVGGMPEVVAKWIETKDIPEVERVQQRILDSYELDFAKHAPVSDIPKLNLIWRSIPDQLARENGKFIFSHAKPGARAKDLEDALEWLISAGMVYKIPRIEKPFVPLSAYADPHYFKLYATDVGLLRKMARLSADAIYQGPETYKEFKGALAENFALTELLNAGGDMPFYWKSRNMAEVDFVTQWNNRIVPIEVKSGTNRTARSLAEYRKRFSPEISVKVSLGNLETGIVMNIPLYLIWKIGDYIGK
ncbi:MAG: ATPase [Omnitrophica bacterium RIFOXYB12_FULL_50_7]|nr:MAG: ATPase [Omnitrophica bacterium RIFOXYB12_FULL_50_7]